MASADPAQGARVRILGQLYHPRALCECGAFGYWAGGPGPPRARFAIAPGLAPTDLVLAAALAALECLPDAALPPGSVLATRSRYLLCLVNSWAPVWERKGFRSKLGAPLKNEATFRRLLDALKARGARVVPAGPQDDAALEALQAAVDRAAAQGSRRGFRRRPAPPPQG